MGTVIFRIYFVFTSENGTVNRVVSHVRADSIEKAQEIAEIYARKVESGSSLKGSIEKLEEFEPSKHLNFIGD